MTQTTSGTPATPRRRGAGGRARGADAARPTAGREDGAGGAAAWVPPDGSVDALRAAAPGCRGCELWADATQVVFSSGSPTAPLMLVGEQPGDREDREGEPFVGPAGKVLDSALEAAGIAPDDIYLTNAVKHFRHVDQGKRRLHKTPTVAHIRACLPWLAAEATVVRPDVVVCLGATAARAVLGRDVPVTAARGHPVEDSPLDGVGTVVVTTHPSALLRLRGKGGWDEAFDAFVADLRLAASLR